MKNNLQMITALKIIAIVMLFGALADNPYGYYQVLRWVVFGVAGHSAYLAYENRKSPWVWIFGIAAILFNPIAPIYLSREAWTVIDMATAAAIFISIISKKYSDKSL